MGEGNLGMKMGDCGRMMHGGSMMDHMMVPQLPPGNEKLQLQMQAQMMQKMGEILAKYAARINEEKKVMGSGELTRFAIGTSIPAANGAGVPWLD